MAPEIREDIGDLLDRLAELGVRVSSAQRSKSFGNWSVELSGSIRCRLIRDRGQFSVAADREVLEPAGLWRVFEDRLEFARLVLEWASA